MTKTQFRIGRELTQRVNILLCGKSEEDVEDVFDDVQLSYNDGEISDEDYKELIEKLSPIIEQ